MARLTTIRKFEVWKGEPGNVEELFRLLVDERMSLRNASFRLKQPYTCIYPMVHDGAKLQERYEAALKAKADEMSHERLEIADEVKGAETPGEVMAAKLRCDVRESLASKWDRERYGEKAQGVGGGITVLVDRTCGGSVAISAGANRVLVGGISVEREVSGAEASVLPAEIEKE